MTEFRYRKGGMKREHQVIPGWEPLLSKLALADGIRLVVPGRIHQARHSQPVSVRLTYPTKNGWKLRIYSGPLVQEIFVVGNRRDIERAIKDLSDVRKLEKHAT